MRNVLLVNAKKIKYYRMSKGIKASELAKKVGVTRQSMSAYEKGIQFPMGDKLKKIAEILGVTTEDLVSFGE
jgi:transcriptional regulator with XRE-family HTH domain